MTKHRLSLLAAWSAIVLLAFAACAPTADKGKATTGNVLPQLRVMALTSDWSAMVTKSYAEVDRDWLLRSYDLWRSEIHSLGVTKWDPRFNCVHFSQHFVAWLQIRYYLQTFHTPGAPADGLAAGVFAYRRQADGTGHALLIVLTQNGREFFEPQTGKFVTLTPDEIKSSWARWM